MPLWPQAVPRESKTVQSKFSLGALELGCWPVPESRIRTKLCENSSEKADAHLEVFLKTPGPAVRPIRRRLAFHVGAELAQTLMACPLLSKLAEKCENPLKALALECPHLAHMRFAECYFEKLRCKFLRERFFLGDAPPWVLN